MGLLLKDGFKTIITITGLTAEFEEIELSMPELDAGGGIDQTTMRNTRWRTMIGKQLVTLGSFSVKVTYSAQAYSQISGILGLNRHVVIRFPDSSTLTFYAIVDKFAPGDMKEGERPEGTITFIPSNLNTASPAVETPPALVTATTTSTTPAPI